MLIIFSSSSSDSFLFGLLGPDGTFSSEAAENYLKRNSLNAKLVYYSNISACFLGLKYREVDRIVVPVFNTTIGYISETIENLNSFKILGNEIISINLYLAGAGKLKDIKYVHSKDEVIQQCRKYLSELNVELVAEDSSAAAAIKVKNSDDRAAIVSRRAAEIYGLNILENKIQDIAENKTEFFILS